MKGCSLYAALKMIGGKNIKITKNHMHDSGFFELADQLYYASTTDITQKPIMVRKAKNRRDYSGNNAINEWWITDKLKELGYEFDKSTLKNTNRG